jgi:hypothetical protein
MNSEHFHLATRYTWRLRDNGNYIYNDDNEVIATVFCHPKFKNWRCVIQTNAGGHHPQVAFETSEAAILHAEKLIPVRNTLAATPKHKAGVGPWVQLSMRHGNSPSYGRHYGTVSVSVRQAKSGHWFYVPYRGAASSPPCGYFASAIEAQAASDNKFLNHHQRT